MKEPLEHKRVLTGGANQEIIKHVRRLAKRGSECAMCGLQAPVEREAARPAHDIGKRKRQRLTLLRRKWEEFH